MRNRCLRERRSRRESAVVSILSTDPRVVIPAKAGIHVSNLRVDSRFRGNDMELAFCLRHEPNIRIGEIAQVGYDEFEIGLAYPEPARQRGRELIDRGRRQ